jgi:hypothetical protein
MIREPAVAGSFYPSDPKALRKMLDVYLHRCEKPAEALAVVSPHAGYIYSGAVAGATFGAVRLPGRFIVLGPNHTGRGAPLALYPSGEWGTPFGPAAIDGDMNARLLGECSRLVEDRTAHAREHSLEVQIPFLQAAAGEFRFSAICVGTAEFRALADLGHGMARAIGACGEPVLIVVSSDMNHYESAEVNKRKDDLAIEQVVALNAEGLHRVVIERDIGMCGFAPAVVALVACRDMGARQGRLVRYSHSGEVTGDSDRVVSYAGMLIQ